MGLDDAIRLLREGRVGVAPLVLVTDTISVTGGPLIFGKVGGLLASILFWPFTGTSALPICLGCVGAARPLCRCSRQTSSMLSDFSCIFGSPTCCVAAGQRCGGVGLFLGPLGLVQSGCGDSIGPYETLCSLPACTG
jgi:hypothetical protein